MPQSDTKRYIMIISVHGLIRGKDLELGRDADTGGQTKYVAELARALIEHPEVDRVDLVTRLVQDKRVSADYAQPFEELAPGVQIVRIQCGPKRYLLKESLWPHLDAFVDNILQYLRSARRAPDLIHGHYADAGFVASRLAGLLNTPMAFTGHSLGRVKRQRLLDNGSKPESIEKRYKIARRIEAEEQALDHAAFVVASTRQEVDEQYSIYDNYGPQRMIVIPPGVDLSRFTPPPRSWSTRPRIHRAITKFLADWGKPMILAISRADARKNVPTLVRAYGENTALQEAANLVLVLGTRKDIRDLEPGTRDVLQEILLLIDQYDLYGNVAYPKSHDQDDIPALYQLAAKSRGAFVNPALTEPFGLTLLEAAACGLPIVATHDGGPRDIVAACNNGLLIDPLDADALGKALLSVVCDRHQWKKWSSNGLRGVHRHYSWNAHVKKYLRAAQPAMSPPMPTYRRNLFHRRGKGRLLVADRILVTDIDNTLIGDAEALKALFEKLQEAGEKVGFGIATGRSMELTQEVLAEWNIPTPHVLITAVGSAIHYGPHLVQDRGWQRHIHYRWKPDALRAAMSELPGLALQPAEGQGEFKISYDVDSEGGVTARQVQTHLRRSNLHAHVIFSHGAYLDLLPIRASKGMALRYFVDRWGIPLSRCLVAGDSGNDVEMLTGNTLGVVVGNHDPELEALRDDPRIYFAQGHYAWGILEGIDHYNFLGNIQVRELETATHV